MGSLDQLNRDILNNEMDAVVFSCAVKITIAGNSAIVHYVPEYGDRDGDDHIDQFIKDASKVLLTGEKLIRRNITIPVKDLLSNGWFRQE